MKTNQLFEKILNESKISFEKSQDLVRAAMDLIN